MPNGIYIRTEVIRKKMSESSKGQIPWNKGKTYKRNPCSEETKKKISLATKGRIFSEEHIKKLSDTHKGKIAWNKGKIGIYHTSEETKHRLSKALKGHLVSEETRRKLSESHKDNHPSEETKRKMSESRRRENLSKETIKRMSKSHKGQHSSLDTEFKKGENCGENSPSWLGGKSFEPYTIQFNKQLKELIRSRDNYKCQLCGMSECENVEKLCIHHVDYNKKNCLPSNLISLCRSCHGKTSSKRKYWTEYFGTLKEED